MDEGMVRERAEAHAKATVAGDLRTAAGDLTEDGRGGAGPVMKAMPTPLESYDVTSVEGSGDRFVATIDYSGGGSTTSVRSTWAEVDGRPMIVALELA